MYHGNLIRVQLLWMHFVHFHLSPYSYVFTEDHSRESRGCNNCPYVAQSHFSPQADVHVDSTARLLLRKENLFRLPHSQKALLLWKKMQVTACLVSGIVARQKEFRKKKEESYCSHGQNLPGTSTASISRSGQDFGVKGTLIHMTYL